jgi:hypothetical protein
MVNPAAEEAVCFLPASRASDLIALLDKRPRKREPMKMNQDQNFDQILELAVVASWADLMRGAQSGLIHIEYSFAPIGTLESLQIWSSITRGHWLLVCAYGVSDSQFHDTGVHFHNGYESEGLAHTLKLLIAQQNVFALPPNLSRAGLLQIAAPTQKESTAAAVSVNEAFDRISCVLADLVLA